MKKEPPQTLTYACRRLIITLNAATATTRHRTTPWHRSSRRRGRRSSGSDATCRVHDVGLGPHGPALAETLAIDQSKITAEMYACCWHRLSDLLVKIGITEWLHAVALVAGEDRGRGGRTGVVSAADGTRHLMAEEAKQLRHDRSWPLHTLPLLGQRRRRLRQAFGSTSLTLIGTAIVNDLMTQALGRLVEETHCRRQLPHRGEDTDCRR